MLIKIINCHKDSRKPIKFSRFRITKWTAPLNSSREIQLPIKVSSNSETNRNFSDFLGDKLSVTPGTRFLRKSRKSGNDLS